ncbi:hypothetical protein EOD39_7986 [Acipenser ruthenus]|uniref:Uncharacterized protein n=1 Tax=Acipenser ruthenus TaxID=7906 RepID=A0A662YYH4_ACIRT|nr:hypothetical protein EOD39_7986 [Acipenser ruthenus]
MSRFLASKDRHWAGAWRSPVALTLTLTVLIPTAPHDDLRHRLQVSPAANSRAYLQGQGSTGSGAPTQQHSCWQFHLLSRQPPQQAPPQPQQPKQGP